MAVRSKIDRTWFEREREPVSGGVIKKRTRLASKYSTVKEIAERFSVGVDRIYDYISSGQLEAIVIGRSYRVSEEAVEAYLELCANRKKRAG